MMIIERGHSYMVSNKHDGDTGTRLHSIWLDILKRCYDKNFAKYMDYGGRGIIICNEWKNDYINFKNWAIQNGYNFNLEIDRKNTNGNYEPTNCRWVTRQQNTFNKRSHKDGKSKYKGVCPSKSKINPWQANICKDTKQIFIGHFPTEIQAAIAYNQKAIELFGEYAHLNEV